MCFFEVFFLDSSVYSSYTVSQEIPYILEQFDGIRLEQCQSCSINECLAANKECLVTVIFSDESRGNTKIDFRHVFIMRGPGKCYHPANIIDLLGSTGILLWGEIMLHAPVPLHILRVAPNSGICRRLSGRRYLPHGVATNVSRPKSHKPLVKCCRNHYCMLTTQSEDISSVKMGCCGRMAIAAIIVDQ
ncbi:hypothetical protein TNCV_906801 [Trichonephila clavipes]|nr:hypothetical protein TNCV_906801 [Trichonephila clavipes]